MKSKIIARAFLQGRGVNRHIPTTPGRGINFVGAGATITNSQDVPHLLRQGGVRVEFEHEYRDWVPEWVRQAGPFIKANYIIVGDSAEPEDDAAVGRVIEVGDFISNPVVAEDWTPRARGRPRKV